MRKNKVIVLSLIFSLIFSLSTTFDKNTSPSEGVVVSYDDRASQIGMEIMKQGGNAVDAAIAVGFALAVVHPAAGNIGGGGFMVISAADDAQSAIVDYREMAPARATRDMFLDEQGKINQELSYLGYLASGVPGTVAGFYLAHQRYGCLPWPKLVEPAIKLADEGFIVDARLAKSLEGSAKRLEKFPSTQKIFFKDGQPYKEGERLIQPDLAKTLKLIASKGKNGFYRGEIAQLIAKDMKANGGIITEEDLASYRAIIRKPLIGWYRGYQIIAPPPPSSGGVAIIEMLNILEAFNLPQFKPHSAQTIHLIAEAMKLAYYDRARYLADPAYVSMNLKELTSKSYASRLRNKIDLNRALHSIELGKALLIASESDATTHYSIIDPQGNAVSNTYTINSWFGNHAVVEGAGFLLNDEMSDFNLKAGLTDDKGNIGTWPNLIEPGKRMLSSMTPVIVLKDGKPYLITGSPGGRRIINTVLHIMLNMIDFHMSIEEAVKFPRFHHQWMPDMIAFEKDAVGEDVINRLKALGHEVIMTDYYQGNAHSIFIDPETGSYQGVVDKRRF
jgi:gamma-glutamyltranspeptidase/glutathione hydrolase